MSSLLNSIINGPAHYAQSHHLSNGPTLIVVLGALLAEIVSTWVFVLIVIKLAQNARPFINLALRHYGVGKHDPDNIFLELIFPSDTTKSAYATEQLHILLRHHAGSPNRWHRFAAYKLLHSLEVYSTNDTGIRFVMVVPAAEEEYATDSLRSFLHGLRVNKVDDYLKLAKDSTVGIIELTLYTDFVLPLQEHKTLTEHDFMTYILGHMTKLSTDGLISYQIITTPISNQTHHRVSRHIRDVQHRLALGKEVSTKLERQRSISSYYSWLLWYSLFWFIASMLKVVKAFWDILIATFAKDHPSPRFMGGENKLPTDNPYEQELSQSIKSKLDQPLYEVSIRVLVASKDKEVIENRLEALAASFRPFSSSHQSIVQNSGRSILRPEKNMFEYYRQRSLTPHFPDQQTVISSSELSDLYHFPNTDLTKTDGLVKSRSTELPRPLSIKNSNTKLDVIVGKNEHGNDDQPIGMTLGQRQKHTYIIGKTGTGKTTLLTSSIYQDMMSGKGLAVLDPHGDMFNEILKIIPEHRRKDVVVFDPADEDYPPSLNILDPGITFKSKKQHDERITSNVVAVFKKLADEKQWGTRMEHILQATTMTALQLPNPNLFTLQRLLTEKKYRNEVASSQKDPVLKQFWQKEFALMGNMQQSSATAPLTHRLGNFITATMSRNISLQEKSTISISDIMEEGKILLVNLSKGDLGEDQSKFFGTIITSFIWMAAFQRTKIPEHERKDFFLYVDEFQNFATTDFSNIASEGRKYHVPLIVSHQNIAQIEDKTILKTVVGNAHSIISLKAGPEDEAFILPMMQPEVAKGDIVNLAPYHFYMKTTADESEDAFSGTTVPLSVERSDETKKAVIAYSRKQYGTPIKTVEAYMEKLFNQEQPKNKRKPGNSKVKGKKQDDKDSGGLLEG